MAGSWIRISSTMRSRGQPSSWPRSRSCLACSSSWRRAARSTSALLRLRGNHDVRRLGLGPFGDYPPVSHRCACRPQIWTHAHRLALHWFPAILISFFLQFQAYWQRAGRAELRTAGYAPRYGEPNPRAPAQAGRTAPPGVLVDRAGPSDRRRRAHTALLGGRPDQAQPASCASPRPRARGQRRGAGARGPAQRGGRTRAGGAGVGTNQVVLGAGVLVRDRDALLQAGTWAGCEP